MAPCPVFNCLRRRELLSVGSLGSFGLSLPQLLQAGDGAPKLEKDQLPHPPPRAKSCILFFMEGGPSQIDLWDMKPDAPEQVRGIFKPVHTTLPGFEICEELPQLARVARHLTVVRSVNHSFVDHNASSYLNLTGQSPLRGSQLIRGPSPENAPPFGSVLAKFRPSGQPLPDYVHLPKRFFNCGNFIPGVLAGFLGNAYDPLIGGDASQPNFTGPSLEARFPAERFDGRRSLREQLDRSLGELSEHRSLERMEKYYQRAFSLVTSPRARQAFRISDEPEALRRRYGFRKPVEGVRGNGLPHLGQSLLLARRLIEAGVRLVSVWAGGQAFDGHTNHFPSLKNGLCPPMDRSVSALIEDLADRGLLDETLFVALAEFGRTPKLGQVTSTAGAGSNGRDHWPHAYTIFLAGAGVKPGVVYGATDRYAAYPTENPVSPQDVAATIYTLLGLNPHTRIRDQFDRPHTLADGKPIDGLFS